MDAPAGPVTAWSILRTDRLGKDSFRVELADAALPDGRLRFSARVDGVGWFTGLADEVLRTESGAGRRLVLRGRGMDALLEDCEFDAQTGTGITPAALATRVLQPVGLSAWSDAQSATGTLKTALGSTGSSIVQDYCASAGLLPPRMLADGRVCLTATRRSGGTALQGGTVRERSVQALAGIGVLHAAGTTYENPAGGRETRWRSALGWPGRGGICPVHARSGRRAPDPAGHARPRAGHDGGVWRPDADAHGLHPPRQRGGHYHGADAGGNLGGASLARGRGGA